jgi:hypothetical protein
MHETKICELCGTAFECKVGDVANCHCSTVSLGEEQVRYLQHISRDCVCGSCLVKIKETAVKGNLQE